MKGLRFIGGGWGNAIYWFNDEKTRIYGFKDRSYNSMCDGSVLIDYANNQNKLTSPAFYIKNVEYKQDPHDMFFADAIYIGELKNPASYEKLETEFFVKQLSTLNDELLEAHKKKSIWYRIFHRPLQIDKAMCDIKNYDSYQRKQKQDSYDWKDIEDIL